MTMRRLLDTLYDAALWLSAACLALIAILVGLQLAGRLLDTALKLFGLPVAGLQILSLAEIAGYMLAAASFLALAPTLKAGAHIRVTMLLSAVSEERRRYLEIFAFGLCALVCAYMTWHLAHFAYFSFLFSEVSYGVIKVPLAIPQTMMALGALVLTVAFADETMIVIRAGRPTFRTAEDAITLGKEG
jgi:TRAP-type C4-dicarboxylate transport system permease small subunit